MLTLKYRPKQFSDLVGQAHIATVVKSIIKKSHEGGGLPAAFLFSGVRGTGKTTTGRIVSSALNCNDRKDLEPCAVCSICKSIQDSRSTYVHEIDAATNGKVENIRGIKEMLLYSHAGNTRVVLLDEAHNVTKEGFDALLKQLEEPQPNTLYIMCTTEPDQFPETIMSRVMQFDFKQIVPDMIVIRLQHIIKQENIKIDDTRLLYAIAHRAQGSMRDAIMSLEQMSHYTDQLTVKKFHEYYGLLDGEMYLGLTTAAKKGDILSAKTLIKDGFSGGVDMGYFLDSFMRGISDDVASRTLDAEQAISMYRAVTEIKSKLRFMPADTAAQFLFTQLLTTFHKTTPTGIKQGPASQAELENIFG